MERANTGQSRAGQYVMRQTGYQAFMPVARRPLSPIEILATCGDCTLTVASVSSGCGSSSLL